MPTRRALLSALALSPLALTARRLGAMEATVTPPDQALRALLEGNARHMKGQYTADALLKDRMQDFTKGQDPHSVIIACSDSRVVPEIIFDAPPGNLFVTRLAGNIVSPAVIASTEYAVQALKVRLVVVLGHTGCGAIGAAVREIEKGISASGALDQLVNDLLPSVVRARRRRPPSLLEAAVQENVLAGVDRLSSAMPTLAPLVTLGDLRVVAAIYDLASGEVRVIG